MPLDPASLQALAAMCAPHVASDTLLAVVRVESGGDPLAVVVNGARPRRLLPRNVSDAVRMAGERLAAGENLDLGLGQINSRNLGTLGLSLSDAFDPCRNLAASARVLQSGWRRAQMESPSPLAALRTAFSLYNTGDPLRGLRNGYAAKVAAAAASGAPSPPQPVSAPATSNPAWRVFGGGPEPSFVIYPEAGARP